MQDALEEERGKEDKEEKELVEEKAFHERRVIIRVAITLGRIM